MLTFNNCTYVSFSFDREINFNNYSAVEITYFTENNQQSGGQLGVGRLANPIFGVAAGKEPLTSTYEEYMFKTPNNTRTPEVYTFDLSEIRKQDNDMGYLCIMIKRGNGDGKVYISKIVVYKY